MGSRLRDLRKKAGLSQVELASHTGIAQALLSKFETSSRLPSTDALVRLADFFGVSVDYLLLRTDKPDINK